MTIAIFGKRITEDHKAAVAVLLNELNSKGIILLVYAEFAKEMQNFGLDKSVPFSIFDRDEAIDQEVNYLISVGGDGTFLDAMLFAIKIKCPVLGINTGRLGFLSNTSSTDIKSAIKDLLEGNYTIENRSLLELNSENGLFAQNNLALNEISIMKRDSSSMITIHVDLDDKHLNSYWTDGLIISTSTGSTAYSLSCGGPILIPGSGNFVITPIAPHNLNVRPIVISDESKLKISVESRAGKNLVALDSRSLELMDNEIITITKAKFELKLVQFKHQSFLSSLRNKLNWGLDKRNSNA